MSILAKFEKGVEGAVNSVFSKIGSRDLKPVDLVTALKKELDENTIAVGNNRKVAPNVFTLVLSTYDFDNIEKWGAEALAEELVGQVSEHATTEGYSFIGAVQVVFNEDINNKVGEYQIRSEAQKLKGSADANLNQIPKLNEPSAPAISASKYPTVDIENKTYELTKPITIVGRGSDADIILEDPSASRKHLELRVTPTGTIASDLGSTNGIRVEGHQTKAATLVNGNTITLGKTAIRFWEASAPTASTPPTQVTLEPIQNVAPAQPNPAQPSPVAEPVVPATPVEPATPVDPTTPPSTPLTPPDPFAELNLSLPHEGLQKGGAL